MVSLHLWWVTVFRKFGNVVSVEISSVEGVIFNVTSTACHDAPK